MTGPGNVVVDDLPWLQKDTATEETVFSDEYANRILNPEHTPKYTKAKVRRTQDKQCVS